MNSIDFVEIILWASLGLFILDALTGFKWVLLGYRCTAWVFIQLELLALALIRRIVRPEFLVEGECLRCGACCEHIVGDPPRWIKETKLLSVYLAYHRLTHRFRPIQRGPNGEVIFSCGHLQSDGRCGIYRFRPLICRNYPVIPYYGVPGLLPDCTYRVTPRVVSKMKSRATLPIINPQVLVHHPTRLVPGPSAHEDYHLVDPIGGTKSPDSCTENPESYKEQHATSSDALSDSTVSEQSKL